MVSAGGFDLGKITGLTGNLATSPAIVYKAGAVSSMTLETGPGAGSPDPAGNTVNVKATPAATTTVLVAGAGDAINVGDGHLVAGIKGGINLFGPPGKPSTLTIDDAADTVGHGVIIDSKVLLGFPGAFIEELTPALITYPYFSLKSIAIKAGMGDDSIFEYVTPVAFPPPPLPPFPPVPVSFDGGGGTNTVSGPKVTGAVWSITGPNAGSVGIIMFTGAQNLLARAPKNIFTFADQAAVAGKIDGGGGGWLDYAAYKTAVAVDLSKGTATGVGGGIKGIQNVRGGSAGSTLIGDTDGNILIGGDGKDTIVGGTGLGSILIGGKGADSVTAGSKAGDIVIGVSTSYDASSIANDEALSAVLAEWQSGAAYSARIAAILAGVGSPKAMLVPKTTVIDDGLANTISGGNVGLNWYFKGKKDTLLKQKFSPKEVVTNTF
jgi:hypothetical protein